MEDVPTPNVAATIRAAQKITTDLLQRGAKVREAADLGEMVLAVRFIRRHRPGITNEQLAEFLEISPATFYRRRERFIALTSIAPEKYPVDTASMVPAPQSIALGLAELPAV